MPLLGLKDPTCFLVLNAGVEKQGCGPQARESVEKRAAGVIQAKQDVEKRVYSIKNVFPKAGVIQAKTGNKNMG